MENVYLGRQPILDKNSDIFAYEILYRDGEESTNVRNDRYASALVVNNILNKFGTHSLLGNRKAFVKIDEKFLLHDLIFSIPKEFFVFLLLSDINLNEREVERIEQLHQKGYLLGINDISPNEENLKKYKKVFKEISFVKLNFDRIENTDTKIKTIVEEFEKNGVKVIASKIEDDKHYEKAKETGCCMFQGYFFAKPNIVENTKYEPAQLNILKLYNLLITDADIDEITSEFEKNHEITLQLLQFINSAAFHFRNKISSIHHILTLMGRIPLSQWLMLMIYSKSLSKKQEVQPLMLMAKNRTNLMQSVLKTIQHDIRSNMLSEAYFVGVLSLMDTVFSVRLEDILKHVNVSDEIKEALLKKKGLLGEIYQLVCDIELFNTHSIAMFEKKYNLKHAQIREIIIQSIEDVNSFEKLI